jgi:TPR repeat protein
MTDYERGLNAYKNDDYKAAIDIFLPLANQGHADSQYKLGQMHECIYYGTTDVESFEYGEVPESELCGKEFGDNKLAFKWYQEAALHGHADAQFNLSILSYFMLEDSESENEQSVHWCKKSANNGHAEAQARLAGFYQDSVPGLIEQDDFLAWKWYEKAVKHRKQEHRNQEGYCWDWEECMMNFADLAAEFLKSNNEDKKELAIAGMVKYSNLGDDSAKIALANFFINDDDLENSNEALNLYNEVITSSKSSLTISIVQWNLCVTYMYGTKHIEVDPETGLNFAKNAANNNPSYYHNMAYLYRGWSPLKADWKKVISCYKKHSESSGWVVESDYELAKIYRNSDYGGLDYAESFKFCKKAAENGGYSETGKEAQYLLAEMYLNGEGTKQNLEKACKWYKEVIKHAKVFSEEC